jgi:hypothetical protein
MKMAGVFFGMTKEKMEKLIVAAGNEIISRAGDLAEGVERFDDLDIWIHFNDDEIPHIDVTKRYVSKEVIKVLAGIDEKEPDAIRG